MALVRTRRIGSWVVERALCAHPLSGHRKIFVMLQAYMDDSGSHRDSHVCVVAGYFGGVNRWREFERKWRKALGKENISEFHAKRFWARDPKNRRVGEYAGWDDQRAERFLDALLCTIEGTAIYPFACGVLGTEWRKLSIQDRKILSGANERNLANASSKPVFLPFQRCVIRVAQYCKPGIVMHFFFDEDRLTKAWATVCHTRIRKATVNDDLKRCMGDLTFADSSRALPLQAADLIAYEASRYCREAKGDRRFPLSPVYGRALTRLKSVDDFWLYDKPRIEQFLRLRNP